MGKRLRDYLRYLDKQMLQDLSPEERIRLREDLLVQIGFFQHERLIHLLVTMTFALLSTLSILSSLFYASILLGVVILLLLFLTVSYVVHYYVLENGVQKLYLFFDKIS